MQIGGTKPSRQLRIAMAGGGTGGHVFPIKSLLERIDKKPNYSERVAKIFRFGNIRGLEHQICDKLSLSAIQIQFIHIFAGKFRRETPRKSKVKNIRDLFFFAIGFVQSCFYLLRDNIDVVFCKGGYVALPVVLAAAFLQKRIIIHESDTRPGLVNKIAHRFASKTFTGFDNVFPDAKTVGQILSDDILSPAEGPRPSNPKTSILVVGGSQGSRRLYNTLLHILQATPDLQTSFDFYLVLGLLNQEMSTEFDKLPNVHLHGFISQKEMGELYNSCDIAITRGGTTALAEQKLYDIRQIIIPIPRTHDQYDNALRYVQHYKDIMLDQKDLSFQIKFTKALLKLKGFKKKESKKDKQAVISKAKEIIVKSILGL